MKSLRKRILAMASVVAVSGLMMASVAGAADKLIVKHATNVANAMDVTDAGLTGFNLNTPKYSVDVATPAAATDSTLHFAYDGADSGGWLSSVGENNFWISSGAVLKNNVWTQKSSDGKSIFFGSGSVGFRAFVNQGATVGGAVTLTEAYRLDYAGNFGLGTKTPTQRFDVNGGVRVNPTTATKPTCDNTTAANDRGTFWFTKNASTGKDILEICAQDASGNTAWRTLY
ncbi:hypothetical protein [Geotalea uraniireducens]|uniref:Uncharacterized protein n=1 Tax=Geotalea uraniireducens (strain Rf4) TaxID=351605 RepID=A5G854_GEOUR|nr:hypothetical protein [Geotalea uraniireducens]ABQ27972.1 hypothetical protein Gura_3822 [Geotalea uraniireducens Rf4]